MTSVTATDGLSATPNPITTTGSIGIATGGVTNDMLAGGITNAKLENSSVTVSPGTGLSGGGPVSLGGSTTLNNTGVLSFNSRTGAVLPLNGDYSFSLISGTATTGQLPATTAYTNSANAFTANQSIAGSLSITGGNITLPDTTDATGTTGVLNLGASVPFLHGFGGPTSTFVGRYAGNFTMNSGLEGGSFNTGVGASSLGSATTGYANAALGYAALVANTTGAWNTALGTQALWSNATGNYNTASGAGALTVNNGERNTASGAFSLDQNLSGSYNIALGYNAGHNVITGSHNIHIDNQGMDENGVIRIGTGGTHTAVFIAGISGVNVGTQPAVLVDTNGQLGVNASSRRFKYDIQDMSEATRKLLQLRPVTFRYKQAQNDGSHPLQYGLIAEEVAEVLPELVAYDESGQPNTVLYHVLPSMLLNEFQKQHQQIEAQKEQIQSLEKQLQQLVSQTHQLQAEMAALRLNRESASEIAAVAAQH